MDEPTSLDWLSMPRSFLWKLGASIVWIVGIFTFVVLVMAFMIPRETPDMTPEERLKLQRSAGQTGAGLVGVAGR